VRYEAAAIRGGAETRSFSGTTRAEVESTLSFKVPGTLTRLSANVGDVVAGGQIIAELDPTDYRVSLHQSEAGLAAARAEFRNAESNYNRVRDLYENRNASTGDLDSARATWESAAAHVQASRQQLEAARLQLSYTRLAAPQECSIAETGRVQTGLQVEVTVEAVSDTAYKAVVNEVGVAAAGGGTAFPVTAVLTGECPELRSGMAADVVFNFAPESDRAVLAVPGLSVGEDRTGRYVYVLDRSDEDTWTARRQAVVIGEVFPDGIEIISGVSAGDLVVTAGVRRVIDGQRVRLLE
jgi:multidrug efflux pump subunit AcrA (membrane-fusion protein)